MIYHRCFYIFLTGGIYTCTVISADKEKLPPKGQEKDEKSRMVSLMVYGNKSVVGPIELKIPGKDVFLPGHIDVFKVFNLEGLLWM